MPAPPARTTGVSRRVTLYEYPFNERIRAFLRLESLFDRLFYFAQPGDSRMHQQAMGALFELIEATERTDLKGGLLQDIERQRQALMNLREHPDVELEVLDDTLAALERVAGQLFRQPRASQLLRENEWLASLRGRMAVLGGTTHVDMPSYHAWQSKDEAARCDDLQQWIAPFSVMREALDLLLDLLRRGGEIQREVAHAGAYRQMLHGKAGHLLRIWVDSSDGTFPDISANKHMIWVRFSTQEGRLRPQQLQRDVDFELALCQGV